eukprot:PLAT9175.3.p1 GENE.PLAT9175.3~~PLAT9175.3.p1  ORF type:complete len:2055 (-),score=888.62 PLAT9175.3:62-6163(-)
MALVLQDGAWLWTGSCFAPASRVAFTAPAGVEPHLFAVPPMLSPFSALLRALGVAEQFEAVQFVRVLKVLAGSCPPSGLPADELQLVLSLLPLLTNKGALRAGVRSKELLLPSSDNKLYPAAKLVYNDAPWLSHQRSRLLFTHADVPHELAALLGAGSLRQRVLSDDTGTGALPCISTAALHGLLAEDDAAELALFDVLEVAQLLNVSAIDIYLDERSHSYEKLVHPALADVQGPAVVIHLRDMLLSRDLILPLLGESRPAGAMSAPVRVGAGLLAAFHLTDCLQILSGDSLYLADGSGQYFGGSGDGPTSVTKQLKADDAGFVERFHDQFAPFLSLPLGFTPKSLFRGAVLRLPLRTADSPLRSALPLQAVKRSLRRLQMRCSSFLLFSSALAEMRLLHVAADAVEPALVQSCRLTRHGQRAVAHVRELAASREWSKRGWFSMFRGGPKVWELETPMDIAVTLGAAVDSWRLPAPESEAGSGTTAAAGEKAATASKEDEAEEEKAEEKQLTPAELAEVEWQGREEQLPGSFVEGWLVAASMAAGDSGKLALDERMSALGSLTPFVSAAALITRDGLPAPQLCGDVFCGVPTMQPTGLPLHINGCFELTRGSRKLSDGHDAHPFASLAGQWNSELVRHGVARCIELLLGTVGGMTGDNPSRLYRYWPLRSTASAPWDALLPNTLYSSLAAQPLFLLESGRCADVTAGFFAPSEMPASVRRYCARCFPMFCVPRAIADDCQAAGAAVRWVTPASLRAKLLSPDAVPAQDAPELLKYCVRGISLPVSAARPPEALRQLRRAYLAKLANGALARFNDAPLLIADASQLALLPSSQSSFLASDLVAAAPDLFEDVTVRQQLNVQLLQPPTLAAKLRAELPLSWQSAPIVQWRPTAHGQPSRAWLAALWRFVSLRDRAAVAELADWPLIPTTSGELLSCSLAHAVLCIDVAASCDEALLATLASSGEERQPAKGTKGHDEGDGSGDGGGEDAARAAADDGEGGKEEEAAAQPAAAAAGGRAGLRWLHPLLAKLGLPVLQLAYMPKPVEAYVTPADEVGVRLLSSIDVMRGADGKCDWDLLLPEEKRQLLAHFADPSESRRLSPYEWDILRRMPLHESHDGQYVTVGAKSALAPADCALPMPSAVTAHLLRPPPQLLRLYEAMGVDALEEAQLLQRFLLAEYSGLSVSEQSAVRAYILANWASLRGSAELLAELRELAFVPAGDRLLQPGELLDPRMPLLMQVFEDDGSRFPTGEFARPEWLTILDELGMRSRIDSELFVDCAAHVAQRGERVGRANTSVQRCAEALCAFFGDAFASLLSDGLGAQLAPLAFVPVTLPAGAGCSLARFQDCAVPDDYALVWTQQPVLQAGRVPPAVIWPGLRLRSPPAAETVLRHVDELTSDVEALENWREAMSATAAFQAIYRFLATEWPSLSEGQRMRLQRMPLIPVGNHFVRPSQLFFRLPENLAPFMFEVPRSFGAHDRLFRQLGARAEPATVDYAATLGELAASLAGAALNASELAAVLRLLALLAQESDTLPLDAVHLPNQRAVLVPASSCLVNDAPWMAERVDTARVQFAHAKLPQAITTALRLPRLSAVVQERLADGFIPRAHAPSAALSARLSAALGSAAVADGLRALLRDDAGAAAPTGSDAVDVAAALTGWQIKVVDSLCSQFTFAAGRRDDLDVTAAAAGSLIYCDREALTLFIAQDALHAPLTAAGVAALAVNRHLLQGQLRDLLPLEAMLQADAADVPKLLHQLQAVMPEAHAGETRRCQPGEPLAEIDSKLAQFKPLHEFLPAEVIAFRESEDGDLRYGVVLAVAGEADGSADSEDSGSAIRRVKVQVAASAARWMRSTDLYSFRSAQAAKGSSTSSSHMAAGDAAATLGDWFGSAVPAAADSGAEREAAGEAGKEEEEALPVEAAEMVQAVQSILSRLKLGMSLEQQKLVEDNLRVVAERDRLAAELKREAARTAELREELEESKSGMQCQICYTADCDRVLVPCGHMICASCVDGIAASGRTRRCPFCRKAYRSTCNFYKPV